MYDLNSRIIKNTELTNNQISLFYLGQEGFLIKWKGKYVLIDGYLSYYVDKNCCSEKVKWVRRYAAPIKAEELDFVDYVFCTHSHYDHADPETLRIISKVNKKVKYIVPKAIVKIIESYGIAKNDIICAIADEKFMLGDISVLPVPAAHEQLNIDENGNYFEMGYMISFGDITVFHAGDCCIYNGLKERLANTDVALLPINGRDYYRNSNDIVGNMDSKEAITLAKQIGADLIIPMHFDLYDVNSVNPAYFVDTLTEINKNQKYHIFTAGERYIYMK